MVQEPSQHPETRKQRFWLRITGGLVVTLFMTPLAQGGEGPILGRRIDDFSLRDFRGKPHDLAALHDRPAIVIVFLGTDCPLVQLYAPRLVRLEKDLTAKGVPLWAINSNRQDTITQIGHFANRHHVTFPILKDPNGQIADRFGATRTPEAFVLDREQRVRYHGRIDDQYGVGVRRPEPKGTELADAVSDLLAGRPVRQPETKVEGCLIGRAPRVAPRGEITYSKQVARIVANHCLECHRPNEIGPFPLTNYKEVAGWAEMIREVVEAGRMPPWFADPRHGQFANDCRLSARERADLLAWIANGVPEGDPADLPKSVPFVDGWRIRQPDRVIYMRDRPFVVPAEGLVDYQSFEVDPGFTSDVWIQAAEARPGNRSVVHHHVAYFVPPKESRTISQVAHQIAGYAPGTPPFRYPPGTALKIPAGSKIVFQLHYTPVGTPQEDRSSLGIIFADPSQVTHEVKNKVALNFRIKIPPGESRYRVNSHYDFNQEQTLVNLAPHMHLRGKSFRFDLVRPDGQVEVLLDVPRYDFNWQLRYDLAQPLKVPAGCKMVCTGIFDNSADNPSNPDPSITVRFGEQTWNEMMVGVFQTVEPVTRPLSAAGGGN